MKKFFGILVVAGALVACNDSAETTETTDTATTIETTPPPPPPVTVDTTVGTTPDTSATGRDTTSR